MTNNNTKINNTNVDMTNSIFTLKLHGYCFLKGLRSPEHESNAQFHVKYFPPYRKELYKYLTWLNKLRM